MQNKKLPDCPVEVTLTLISNKWKILIIRDLLEGTKRFGELKKSVTNISQKVLTSNLREMEENNLLTRKVYPEVPPKVEYSLTEIGKSLSPLLDAMDEFLNDNNIGASSTLQSARLMLDSNEPNILIEWYEAYTSEIQDYAYETMKDNRLN